jgi:hypothetical protein
MHSASSTSRDTASHQTHVTAAWIASEADQPRSRPMPRDRREKYTSYSPPARVPMSPTKERTDKLRIGGSDDSGRCSTLKQGKAYENAQTWNVQKLKDI